MMPPRSDEHNESTALTKNQRMVSNHMSFNADDDDDDDDDDSKEEDPQHYRNHYRPFNNKVLQYVLMGSTILFAILYIREKYRSNNDNKIIKNRKHAVQEKVPETTVPSSTSSKDSTGHHSSSQQQPTGPYQILQCQEGNNFFDFYDFYDGKDSEGSAGYNTYVSEERAKTLGIANVTREQQQHQNSRSNSSHDTNSNNSNHDNKQEDMSFVYMKSASTTDGPRESVRLEGRTLFNRGLFILDVRHMPAGCGVWPAFWLTNEEHWPDYGEIDILENINNQTQAKTALHTSRQCSMYAHVADYNRTGIWDRATGLPDTFTGNLDTKTSVPADDCWNLAPHQWANQGCVTVSQQPGSIGIPINEAGGGIYVLEWDPIHTYIRSWVFSRNQSIPTNLQQAIETAHLGQTNTNNKNGKTSQQSSSTPSSSSDDVVVPDPQSWGLPYAYFAIGEGTGCSADHFRDMRIVFNLAFCGTVAGNRFGRDCPVEAETFTTTKENNNQNSGPVQACNAYIQSQPDILSEAYWKIRGVYVYERKMESSTN